MRTCSVSTCMFYNNGICTGDNDFYKYSKCIYANSPLIETSDEDLWWKPFKFGPIIGIGCPPKTKGVDRRLIKEIDVSLPSEKIYYMDF